MNIQLLQEKLLSAAKSDPPSDHVPYAFEKRILARLQGKPTVDTLSLWVRELWRAAVPCLGLMLVLSVWVAIDPGPATPTATASLGSDLETTLMASVSFDNTLPW